MVSDTHQQGCSAPGSHSAHWLGWPHSGHILLARGERSRLADFASEVL